jgi:hydroxyacylglutathione hydrolase
MSAAARQVGSDQLTSAQRQSRMTVLKGNIVLLFALLAACVFTGFLQAQSTQSTGGNQPVPASWFSASKVSEGLWIISDHGSDNIYLVEGNDKALLIDTGLGMARLSTFLKTLTSKPLIVVNTHGHPDHAGGDFEFKSVYAHPADFSSIQSFGTKEARQRTAQFMGQGPATPDRISADEAASAPQPEMLPIRDGQMFDLGGRTLEVIGAPGHTPGEIVLLDAAHKVLFTGDNSNQLVWLFLPNSMPLEVYLQTLKKLEGRTAEYMTIYPGHGKPMPSTFIGEQIACVEGILHGTIKGEPQHFFTGDAMVAKYKTAAVAYNPANLRVKK